MDGGSFPGLGVELVCKHGHPVTKLKKLRPWQGHVKDRACASCARPIDRKALRWRCNHHCDWDLCEACYNDHWRRVIHHAVLAKEPGQRLALLEAVPEQRRPRPDDPIFKAAAQVPPSPHALEAGEAPGSPAEGASRLSSLLAWALLALLACAWALASVGFAVGSTDLLNGGPGASFPDPWLLSGVSHLLAAVCCKVVALLLRYDAADDKEAVDTMSATVLGVMLGLEGGLYAKVLGDLQAQSRQDAYVLRPLVLAAAGMLAQTNPPTTRLAVSACGAVLVGLLACSGGPHPGGFLDSLPWLALAGCITIFRWVFTLNVLPRHGTYGGLWCFAGQLLWPAGLVGFEVAFLSDYGSYRQLLQSPPKSLQALQLLLGTSLLAGLRMMAELRIVQATSLWGLGLCIPLVYLAPLLRDGEPGAARTAALALYALLLLFEGWTAWQARRAAAADPGDGYVQVKEATSPRTVTSAGGRSAGARSGPSQSPVRPLAYGQSPARPPAYAQSPARPPAFNQSFQGQDPRMGHMGQSPFQSGGQHWGLQQNREGRR